MGNEMKVVVTRAPRIKKMPRTLVADKTCVISNGIVEGEYLIEVLHRPACVIEGISLPYNLNLLAYEVVPFGSFEDMCKWVAGGKKLEDLQVDPKSEWIPMADMEIGQYGEVVALPNLENDVVRCISVTSTSNPPKRFLALKEDRNWDPTDVIVWPLGAGDTIMITAP